MTATPTTFNFGETWQFSVSYTVTDDIDNGGVFNPALTHDNTATGTTAQAVTGAAWLMVDQNPHVCTLVKSATVPGGTADHAGEVIAYTIGADSNMTLTSPVVSDPSVSDLAAVLSGGFMPATRARRRVDLGETWQYPQATPSPRTPAGRSATPPRSPPGRGPPTATAPRQRQVHVVLDKTATVPGGTADAAEVMAARS